MCSATAGSNTRAFPAVISTPRGHRDIISQTGRATTPPCRQGRECRAEDDILSLRRADHRARRTAVSVRRQGARTCRRPQLLRLRRPLPHPPTPAGQPPDPLADKFYPISPYSYCGGDPINKIDPDGLAWHLIEEDEKEARFEWVEPQKSYDQEGNLLPDHYEQAISFSASGSKGSYDSSKMYNMGTSTATVYKADGTTEDFDACTKPADPSKYATVPKGRYEAKVGMHKNSYPALRMGDVGTTNFNNNSIELGEPNPSSPARTTAIGINIHRAGENNLTGIGGIRSCSIQGCFLIDRNRWDEFINIFNTPEQRNNTIGIITLR